MSEGMPPKLGRYEVVRELGKGAMGVVYEGRDPNIGRRVAIKTARLDVLEKAGGRASELMERFLREARAMGGISHPNILTVYDAGEEQDMAFIAMEFMTGGDLGDWMAKQRSIEPEKAVDICACVASALSTVHKAGIVHRDIKPDNIMVLENGEIKVADFGIAHVSDSNLTQEGSMIGTPHYMSPEQFQGKKIDGRTDLWAVGVMLYEMLTKEKPFDGDSLTSVMTRCMRVDPVPPHELDVMIPEALSRVCMKALSKSPNTRYQSGDDFAAAMREALKENPDPLVLKLGTAMEQTVVSGGAEATLVPGADATVIAGAPAAPVPGDQGTVIQTPANAATVPLSPDATAPGGPPPNAAAAATIAASTGASAGAATMPGAGPTTIDPPKKGLPLGIIAVVVVVVVVGGVAAMMGGGGGGGEEPNSPGASTNVSSLTYKSLEVRVLKAETLEDMRAYDANKYDQLKPAAGATVEAFLKKDGLSIGKYTTGADGVARFDLTREVTEPPYMKATLDGYMGEELSLFNADPPSKQADTLSVSRPLVVQNPDANAAFQKEILSQ